MRRLEDLLHDLAEQDERLPTSELITRIERGLSSEGVLTVATMDGRSAMDAQENTRQDRRRIPMMVAAGAALLVLIVVGLPILLLGSGDSEVVGQSTSVVSTTSTSTTTTIPGITVATEAVLAGLLERLGDTYIHYTSPPEEDRPPPSITIGDLENAIYVVWAPIVVELLDAMEAASANLKNLSDSGHLYDFEQDVDALTVAIDDWLVALRWYHDPNLNCFPLLSDEARNLIVGELWNQTEWAECMNANITTEDMETMKQGNAQVKELLDSLMSVIGSGGSG